MKIKFTLIIDFLLLFTNLSYSQNISLPLHSEIYYKELPESKALLKSPVQPYVINYSLLRQISGHSSEYESSKDFTLQLYPIINNSFFSNFSNDNFFQTGNGLKITSTIFKNLSIDVNYTYNYISLPHFAKTKIDSTSIIPHYSKASKTGNNYYFNDIVGEINYSPNSYINLSFGNKHSFLGNGNRSLFLSDNAGNFWSFKALVEIWNIDYLFQTSFLQDIHKTGQPYDLEKKFGTFHFISWDVTPRFNLNFFESVVWAPDDSTINRGYDINYLNPVVFFRPVEFSVGSPDNILLGLGSNVEILKNTLLYSQFILDEFNLSFIKETEKWWANKFGYQFGIKYWKQTKNNSLIISLEHNWMRPFTYSHAYSSKSYGNSLQALAHPLGANFREWILNINYSRKKIFIENNLIFQQYGTDSLHTNYGNNIYKSNLNRSLDYGSEILQGIQNNVLLNQTTISYLFIPKWFTFIDFGITLRSHKYEKTTENDLYFSLGIRTGINRKNVFDSKY